VLEQLRATEVKDGILGSFRFDRNGDITPASVTILRVTGRGGDGGVEGPRGMVVDRLITVPAELAE